jgi:hypothetical protein
VPPPAASPPAGEGERGSSTRTKHTRNILKKAPRRDSLQPDTSSTLGGEYSEDESTVGYQPRLGQIREGKKSKHSRSRTGSTVSSATEPRTQRRRKIEDHAVDRARDRYTNTTLQRHAGNLANMSNPSLLSVQPELTEESHVSNESNMTVTQRPQDDRSPTVDSESEDDTDDSEDSRDPEQLSVTEMETGQPSVFQYMQEEPTVEEYSDEEEHGNNLPSTNASSTASGSDDSEHEDTRSSNTGSSQLVRDTPTTSPASMRMSDPGPSHGEPRKYRNTRRPLYASSFVHGHGGQETEEEAEEEGDHSEEESDDGEDEDEDEDEDEHDNGQNTHPIDHAQGNNRTLGKVSPPRAPSTSSGHNDSRARRLQQQERELANHVLQSPQPHKDFQFAGGPSPHPQPSMPLYSPHAYSNAMPASLEPTTSYPAEWPSFPPPLPIGFPTQPTLESPTAGHALPLTVQPPMGMSSLPVQQFGPPFHQHPGQPPQYQAHAPAPEGTRTMAAGYELLANKLSETPKKGGNLVRKGGRVVPMYRKFEHLNHRVLLHLQDEVCELEEELRYLDESIMQMSPRDDSGHAFPASRRGDARYGSELHYKRTELLGRIFQKLGQYSKCAI